MSIRKKIRYIVTIPIIVYQKTISPDHGLLKIYHPYGYCKFQPSCSEYSRRSIMKYGILKGFIKGIWRILRCNPWSAGGIDNP